MAFADDVVERRKAFVELEDRAAKAMHDELQTMLDEAKAKLDGLSDYTDTDGKLVNNEPSRKRMQAIIRDIQGAINDACLKAKGELIDARETAFKMGAATLQYATEKATGHDFETSTAQIFTQAAKEAATRKVLLDPSNNGKDGTKPDEMFDNVNQWTQEQVQDVLSKAILRGQSIDKTSKQLQAKGDVTKRAATRIVRTNVNAAMNEGHMAFYRDNPEVFSGVRWDAVMDARTSTICAGLNGRFFTLQEEPPGPPAHPNCRCTLVGVLADDLAEEDKAGALKRVKDTATGEYQEVPRDRKFAEWLKEQPASKSKKITGSATKDLLFRDGHLELNELVKPNLKTRTDKEAVELALAKEPDSGKLQALAEKVSAAKRSLQEIDVEDALLAAQNKFNRGSGDEDEKRRKRLDEEQPPQPPVNPPQEPLPPSPRPGDDWFMPSNPEEAQEHWSKQGSKLQDKIDELHNLASAENRHRITNITFGTPEYEASKKKVQEWNSEAQSILNGKASFLEDDLAAMVGACADVEIQPYVRRTFDTQGNPVKLQCATTAETEKAQENLDWARKFITDAWKSPPVKFVKDVDDRAFYRRSEKAIYASEKTDKSTWLHEWCHHLEYENPQIHKATTKFLKDRTKGEPLEKLRDITGVQDYELDEVARRDEFEKKGGSVYMGKFYYTDSNQTTIRATEILTMGMERMVRNPVNFAKDDPDYFKLIWSVMDGSLK